MDVFPSKSRSCFAIITNVFPPLLAGYKSYGLFPRKRKKTSPVVRHENTEVSPPNPFIQSNNVNTEISKYYCFSINKESVVPTAVMNK